MKAKLLNKSGKVLIFETEEIDDKSICLYDNIVKL